MGSYTFATRSARSRAQIVRRVCERLEADYEVSRLGNPRDPLNDLIYVLISTKTPPERAQATYERLKCEFPDWRAILQAEQTTVIEILKPAGLSRKKAAQILSILRQVVEDFGVAALDELKSWEKTRVWHYLTGLPGVSHKVAKCVMLYALGLDVLPVDIHTYRLAKRLGWVTASSPEACYEQLEDLIPPGRRFAFHVNSVLHGRTVCRASNPNCLECSISRHCEFGQTLGLPSPS